MNGHTENKKNTYAHLDRLSTEALEELLCADIKSLDDDDDEVVLHILEVIEQREKAIPTGRLSDVDKALEEFQTYYNIPEMNGVTLYPEETAESVTDAVTMVGFIPKRPWIRVLGTIAATVIFMRLDGGRMKHFTLYLSPTVSHRTRKRQRQISKMLKPAM